MVKEIVLRRKSLAPKSDGRLAILDAAKALLAEHGGSRFSLAEVAARSKRNIALVSYYFGGKEEMLLAILDEDEAAILGPIRVLAESNLSAKDKLEHHIAGLVELHARRPYWSPLIHELLRRSGNTIAKDIAYRFVRPVIALQKSILDEGAAAGVFRTVDPFIFYLHTIGAIDMFTSAHATLKFGFGYSSNDKELRARVVRETLSLLMDGLRPDDRKRK
jgi:TetR/AcrR family transcriptional regulator